MTYSKGLVVSIKCNGKILRDNDNNNIYLPFESEYSILFKNLTSKRCCVSVDIDGMNILNNNQLIINPNETQELERFFNNDINKGNKFKFIKKTQKISDYRGDRIDDGIIRIEHQFEKDKKDNVKIIYEYTNPYTPYPYYPPYYTLPAYIPHYHFYSSTDNTIKNINNNDVENHCYYNSIVGQNESFTISSTINNTDNIRQINEDGITVKGSESNQHFNYTNIGELENKEDTIIFKLNGQNKDNNEIKKEISIKDKMICQTCGTSNKSLNKYCRECGTYLF